MGSGRDSLPEDASSPEIPVGTEESEGVKNGPNETKGEASKEARPRGFADLAEWQGDAFEGEGAPASLLKFRAGERVDPVRVLGVLALNQRGNREGRILREGGSEVLEEEDVLGGSEEKAFFVFEEAGETMVGGEAMSGVWDAEDTVGILWAGELMGGDERFEEAVLDEESDG